MSCGIYGDVPADCDARHPKRIPGSPFWALTNTDTPQKRDILSTALKTLGYDPTSVNEAVEKIM
jgi:negative regulator of replication initiation